MWYLFNLNYAWFYFEDIDECNSGLHNCHAFAACSNTFGGFTCQCRTGYAGNGTFCRGEVGCGTI